MDLISIFLVITDVEHILIYRFAICMPSLEKMSLQVLWPFFTLFFNKYFYCCSITVVTIFPQLLSPALPTAYLLYSIIPPIVSVLGSFIHVSWLDPSPPFPSYPLPCSPLVTVSLFFISMSPVIFCLIFFCCCCCRLGSTYRWDHMVFVFHRLAYFI